MRDKVLKLLSLTMQPFDKAVEGISAQYKAAFEQCIGELNDTDKGCFDEIHKATLSGKDVLQDEIAKVYEMMFSEEEVDQLNAFFGSPIGIKWKDVGNELLAKVEEATANWSKDIFKGAEPAVSKLLGVPGEAPAADMSVPNTPSTPTSDVAA